MREPFVSFIIPVYNKEMYVGRCITSLLRQTEQDFELIVVDDGSTDRSVEVISGFCDRKIRLFRRPNGGVSNARNYGMSQAKGRYIIFIDSDDYVDDDFLATLRELQEQYPDVDLFLYGLSKCDTNGHLLGVFHSEVKGYQPLNEFYATFMREQGTKGVYGYVSTKMIRRRFIEQYDIHFDENIRLAEDYNFYLDLFFKQPIMYFSDYCGYHYVQEIENSSFCQKNVDYLSLIRIWLKSYVFLSERHSLENNKFMLCQKIAGLNESFFREMDIISYREVRSSIFILHDMEEETGVFSISGSFVQSWIADRKVFCLYMYLKLRRLSHLIRRVR